MAAATAMVVLYSCSSCSSLSPQENFRHQLQNNIGKKKVEYPASWHESVRLIGSIDLHNGNIEYRYRFRRACEYVLVVDGVTNTIIATRIEGNEADCTLPP